MPKIIEASGTQVSDAINLATYKANLHGVDRNIIDIARAGDKAYVTLGGGSTINITMTPGAYPAIQSITTV